MKFSSQTVRFTFAITCIALIVLSCNNPPAQKKEAAITPKKDTSSAEKKILPETNRPPIINIMDTLAVKRIVLCMKDSAASFDRISLKLGEIYGTKIASVLKKNNLKMAGQPMAWYNTTKPPYYFEAGLPVDKKPSKLPANIFIREIGADSVVIAHFYGRYNQVTIAYDALKDWIKGHKKTLKGKPYEVYVDDPVDKDGKMKDPYKVQTDIIFTWK